MTYHTPTITANDIKKYANEIFCRMRQHAIKPTTAAKSTTMTGPNSKRYELQKTVIPCGTSAKAIKNKATANQARIRADTRSRLLLGFATELVEVLMEPNDQSGTTADSRR